MATFADNQLGSSFDNSSIQYLHTAPVPIARRVIDQLKAEDVMDKDTEEKEVLRMVWSEAMRIKDQSGWSATEDGSLTANEGSFKAYFEAHPLHTKFKDTLLTFAEELTYLFSTSTAKGGSVGTSEVAAATAATLNAGDSSIDKSVDLTINLIDIDSLSTRKRAIDIANHRAKAAKK
nr:hypothetical protein CFP56_24657 [Quercus suber]